LIYVILNLAGSVLFLIAVALLYGTLGTLNLADMAAVLPVVPVGDQALVRTAATLLSSVFALKAALLCRCRSGCRTSTARQAPRSPRCSRS
jgi:multicomponent K+:H+ antiporter subunit D